MQYTLNPNLRAIIEYIKTSPWYVDLLELMDWCEENNYLKEFYNNIIFINAFIEQHNESTYINPYKKK